MGDMRGWDRGRLLNRQTSIFGREDVDSASWPCPPGPALLAWFWAGVGVG